MIFTLVSFQSVNNELHNIVKKYERYHQDQITTTRNSRAINNLNDLLSRPIIKIG